jgi:uncharacterized membrane protein YdjX (TVP38/TMEM64 family)
MKIRFWLPAGILAAAGVSVLLLAGTDPAKAKALYLALMQWLSHRGLEAAFWVAALQALMVILTVPGPFFTVGAGFLFGTWQGGLVAVCGSMGGAVVAYWIGRSFPRGRLPGSFGKSGKAGALLRFVSRGGWQVVLATRLLPFFPFKLSNYFFGWTRFPFRHFFWGTFLGIIPVTLISVSTGSLAADLAALADPEAALPKGQWLWSAAGLALALSILLYLGSRARRELREFETGEERG